MCAGGGDPRWFHLDKLTHNDLTQPFDSKDITIRLLKLRYYFIKNMLLDYLIELIISGCLHNITYVGLSNLVFY